MKIPSALGITGLVYRTNEVFVCQNIHKELRYNADIDNLGGSTSSAENLIMGSLYGHSNTGKKKPVGILQLVNKNNQEPITDYDKVSLEYSQLRRPSLKLSRN
jgi:hypothetical protein